MIPKSIFFLFLLISFTATCTAEKSIEHTVGSEPLSENILAKLENNNVRVTFFPTTSDKVESVSPVYEVNTPSGWFKVPISTSAESYQVLVAEPGLQMEFYRGFMHPKWKAIEGADEIDNQGNTQVIWNAGIAHEGTIKRVRQDGKNRVFLEFYPLEIGALSATWELKDDDASIKVDMHFTPKEKAQYSLGYFIFNSQPIDDVDELLMPMLVQRKRFPERNYTQLQAAAPTPVSLMQTSASGRTLSWGVSGEPTQVPFEFPIPLLSRYGLHIKNTSGEVQPSIFGPLLGTDDAHVDAGETLSFSFRMFVKNGDWYSAYRYVADNLFGWEDYRQNGYVSMTESVYNMIDLYMDDHYGGWWERAKANYQIESKNGSTQSSPLTIASLYRLTGDTAIYRRRTLPTMEYILSRDNPHFSPEPENTGNYARGHMNGPVDIFGSTVYAGIWEMMNYRTPVFKDIAFPDGEIKPTTRQQNFIPSVQAFDELVGKYLFTGDESALAEAIKQADQYIEEEIVKAPESFINLREFFLMAFTPNWEGLLRLYEITGEDRFLKAAEKAAHITMTGKWTQPMPQGELVTIHPNDEVHGDKMDRWLDRGEEEFRLGFLSDGEDYQIKEGVVREKKVPDWLVSNAGLGFEQPSTYTFLDNGGRLILQANWTGGFFRLAQYTGDKQFETYARNAALGRMGNYAGYYYTTFTDLYQNPRYPYEGPDIGFIYFHHIPVHISWTIDYLVSAVKLASDGNISFPGLRQFGYAYFDNLIYGHAPGEVYGQEDVWLWFDKNLVEIDNVQINYLTAQSGDKFYLIMMNESQDFQKVNFTFNPQSISKQDAGFEKATVITDNNAIVHLTNNRGELYLPPRGFEVVEVGNLNIDVATHKQYAPPVAPEYPYYVEVDCEDGTQIRAASIQMLPGGWDAYVYSTAESKTLDKITLHWETESSKGTLEDFNYPYEFSVPVQAGDKSFSFSVEAEKKNGERIKTSRHTIGVVQ